jgi:WD40 repeat protein
LTFWKLPETIPTQIGTLPLASAPSNEPAFSRDSRFLALASGDQASAVGIWDVSARERIALLTGPADVKVGPYGFSRDGALLATAYDNGSARLWDTRTWRESHVLSGHSQRVTALAFSPVSDLLATGSTDTTVRLWMLDDRGSAPQVLQGDGGGIYSLAFSPDGQTLAAGGVDGSIKLWSIRARRELATLKAHGSIVSSLAFSPDGGTLASISVDETMRLWKAPSLIDTDR